MRYLKKALNDLNWKNGNLFDNVVVLKQQLKEAQSNLVADPFSHDIKRKAMEIHSSILKSRKNKNRVESICGEDGERFEGNKVADQFVNHFQNFLGKSVPVKPLCNLGDIAVKKVSMEVAGKMIVKVTDEEIKRALFDIDSNKAAGPNGFTTYFFKKAWNIIGKDIFLAVKDFFKNGKMLGELNATLIALVLKIDTPGKVSDFRPIAYCNVLYKCISKILTDRIKEGLSMEARRERVEARGSNFSLHIHNCDEVLNMIMIKEIKESGKFKYHYGCKDLKLTHMCFADDLLILCNGDKESFGVVKKVLNEFSNVSGLLPNLNKITIFFGSVNK
ncbi:hypothetical protein Tco_0731998, partial [Tanacetum coccineum]